MPIDDALISGPYRVARQLRPFDDLPPQYQVWRKKHHFNRGIQNPDKLAPHTDGRIGWAEVAGCRMEYRWSELANCWKAVRRRASPKRSNRKEPA